MGPNNQTPPHQPVNPEPNPDGSQSGQPALPYFLQPDPNAPALPTLGQKSKKKRLLFVAAIVVLAVLIAAAAAITFGTKSAKKATTAATTATATQTAVALTTKAIDGVQFSYPKAWQQIDASQLGFTLGYGSASSYGASNAAIYYKKTQLFPTAETVASVSAADKQAVADAIVAGIQSKNTGATGDCIGYKLLNHTELSTATYFGVDADWSCTANAFGAPTRELDRYLYTGDGNLYQVSIHGVELAWQGTSLTTLQTMYKQIVSLK